MNELALFAGEKRCSKCSEELPHSAFYLRSGGKSHHSACKLCERAMAKNWYERNKDKATAKVREWRQQNGDVVKRYRTENRQKHYRQELVRKYGVEQTWFDEQLRRQGNSCSCCKREFQWGDKQTTPHVDHCHNSQVVRGILCNRCNTVLGLCQDDDKLLSALSRYLEKCRG